MTKYISAMELTTLLSKTEFLATNLTVYEFRLLAYLLARVNKAKMLTHGYLAWPGTDDIIKHTGMSSPTIERIRKTLVAAGWMKYISGKGPNSSNHYYINAQMIVDAAVKSGERCPDGIVAPTVMEENSKKPHKRNTAGLVQNKDKPKEPIKPVTVESVCDDVPDWAKEPDKPATPPQKPVVSNNEDGSPKYYMGVSVRTWSAYHAAKENKRIADMNESGDDPF